MLLTPAELIRALIDAVEAAKPTIDADGPALVFKWPVGRIELRGQHHFERCMGYAMSVNWGNGGQAPAA